MRKRAPRPPDPDPGVFQDGPAPRGVPVNHQSVPHVQDPVGVVKAGREQRAPEGQDRGHGGRQHKREQQQQGTRRPRKEPDQRQEVGGAGRVIEGVAGGRIDGKERE